MNLLKQAILAISSLGLFGGINWLAAFLAWRGVAWRGELKNKEENEK